MKLHPTPARLEQRGARARRGFTLLEVLGAIVITAMIATVIIDFYLDLSRANERAVLASRAPRQAMAVLDTIARDLQEAYLIQKEATVDPLEHPWLFIGQERGANSRLLFFTRHTFAQSTQAREWDVARVAYALREDADGTLALWRTVLPGLPDKQESAFPEPNSPGEMLLSPNVRSFHLEYLDELGAEWVNEWDSTTLAQSGQLPLAVRIDISLGDINLGYEATPLDETEEPLHYTRLVLLPMRPLSPDVFVASGDGTSQDSVCEERGAGATVFECTSENERDRVQQIVDSAGGEQCFYHLVGAIDDADSSLFALEKSPNCREAYDNYWEDQNQ